MIVIFSTIFDPSTDDVINWLYYYKASFDRVNGEDFMDESWVKYLEELIGKTKSAWYRRHFRYDVYRNYLINKYSSEFDKLGLINTYELLTHLSAELRNYIDGYYELFANRPSINNHKNWRINKQIVLKYAELKMEHL